MIKQILPVPVLAEPCGGNARTSANLANQRQGEARESAVPQVRHAQRSSCNKQKWDSRGGQKLSDDDELAAWLATLPRKTRFNLAMAISALSLERGKCRSRDDLLCFLSAAGLPLTRQAIENIECRALRKCRRTELAALAKEHLTIK